MHGTYSIQCGYDMHYCIVTNNVHACMMPSTQHINAVLRCACSYICERCREWLAMDKERTIAAEKARIEEEEANMLVGPELPAGVSKTDMGDYGGALLPGMLH